MTRKEFAAPTVTVATILPRAGALELVIVSSFHSPFTSRTLKEPEGLALLKRPGFALLKEPGGSSLPKGPAVSEPLTHRVRTAFAVPLAIAPAGKLERSNLTKALELVLPSMEIDSLLPKFFDGCCADT